jgi:hypothetical protein
MKIRNLLLIALVFLGFNSFGQTNILGQDGAGDPNVITTAVPFLSISPDARGGAMGDCGVASTPDVFSMHYNPAKYSFLQEDMAIGLGYSPWLRNLVSDMNLAYLAFAKKLNAWSAIGATLRYFSCGDITFTDINNQEMGTYSPNEWAVDATYSRLLGDYLSGAVAGRFIYSNLTQGVTEGSSIGWSVAADVAVYYERPVEWFDFDTDFSWGVSINNIGSKVRYSTTSTKKDFIPTYLKLGPSLKMQLDEYNSLAFNIDLSKLLVPTPPHYAIDSLSGSYVVGSDGSYDIASGMDNNVSTVMGMLQSFYDAPGGFSEELQEINLGLGVEYWYNNVFAVRAGYFNETKIKGNRKYFTLGAALKYTSFNLDISYLVPVNGTVGSNPLEDTLRFNLTYLFGSKK